MGTLLFQLAQYIFKFELQSVSVIGWASLNIRGIFMVPLMDVFWQGEDAGLQFGMEAT